MDTAWKVDSDILLIILELCHAEHPSETPALRLVSRAFDIAVTPIAYRKWVMKTEDLDWEGCDCAVANVRNYTRQAVFKNLDDTTPAYRTLDWNVLLTRFKALPRLQKMTWILRGKSLSTCRPIPVKLLRPGVELYLEVFVVPGFTGTQLDLDPVPQQNLVSLKTIPNWPPLWASAPHGYSLNRLVRGSKIHTLHVDLKAFQVSLDEHCPPLKELVLMEYNRVAHHTHVGPRLWPVPILAEWNARELVRFETNAPLDEVLKMSNLGDFSGLQFLRIEARELEVLSGDWSTTFYRLLECIYALHEFKLRTNHNRLDLHCLERHMGSLRLLDIQGKLRYGSRPHCLRPSTIERISELAHKLEDFTLDFELLGHDWRNLLPKIAQMPKLRTINLHVMPLRPMSRLRNESQEHTEYEYDLKIAQDVVLGLVTNKLGKSFKHIEVLSRWYRNSRDGGDPKLNKRHFVWNPNVPLGRVGVVREDTSKYKEKRDWL